MKGIVKTRAKGLYNVILKNSVSGEVIENHTFHNISTAGLSCAIIYMTNWENQVDFNINRLQVGSGTKTPSYSDSSLNSALWTVYASSSKGIKVNEYTYRYKASFVFPATSGYVGSIREAGLLMSASTSNSNSGLVTHALFTDSENNIISINKTALDILTINVEFDVTLGDGEGTNFKLFKNPISLSQITTQTNYAFSSVSGYRSVYRGHLCLFKYDEDANFKFNPSNFASNGIILGSYNLGYIKNLNKSRDDANKTFSLSYPNQRIANTSITSETYYRGVCNTYFGCFMFPNENSLPTYDINNIDIGRGDGETTTFNNPLSYFKKNTETIYIDNEPLVRGVDYTINHMGNINKKFEICQNIKPNTAVSDLKIDSEIWSNCPYSISSMFKPTTCAKKLVSEFDTDTECYGINSDNPAILDFGEEKTFNFIKGYNIRVIRKAISGGAYSTTTSSHIIYIDCSDDKEEWEEVKSVTISSNSINIDFDSQTARYWRLRTSLPSNDSNYNYILSIFSSAQNIHTEDCGIAFGNYDPQIAFTEPPAEDSVITMDVKMDVIMKNENFVIDLSPSIVFKAL